MKREDVKVLIVIYSIVSVFLALFTVFAYAGIIEKFLDYLITHG